MSTPENLIIEVQHAIEEIPAAAWDACACPDWGPRNPFLSHAFLHAAEASGSAVPERGWQAAHICLKDGTGSLLAVAPAYIKAHSMGEYVFDQSWADAFQRAGGHYYPKLLCAVPFTPATGPRLLTRENSGTLRDQLVTGCLEAASQLEVSSMHFNFLTQPEWQRLGELGLLQRMDQQFHWHNEGYGSFDDFLTALASKKRKNLKRERREATENGIEIEWVTGSDLSEAHWDAFYQFYVDTGSRKWGRPYLTREFFSRIGETMADDILLIMCRRAGRYIAGALNFIGSETLFGRNWGCIEDHRFLHFETCYYQAIEFAISRGLKRVEAGAQGAHKVARGYLPAATYSAHWIAHPGLRDAVAEYLKRERNWVSADIEAVNEHSPFRQSQVDGE